MANKTNLGDLYTSNNEFNANVTLTIGNTSVNSLANSIAISLVNSTVTWTATKPTAAQVSAANYFLASDSTWKIGGSPNPTSDDGQALGTTSLKWSDLFLASGSVINWNSGDVTCTHAANLLTFSGATTGYRFGSGPVCPETNAGSSLGHADFGWDNLIIESNRAIKFSNPTTHTAENVLAFGSFGGANWVQINNSTTGQTPSIEAKGGDTDVHLKLSAKAAGVITLNGSSERLRIDDDGVKFHGDTAASNALDDYEEGTWTPSYVSETGSYGSITYEDRDGWYVKIGSLVFFSLAINTSNLTKSTGTGGVMISGLPFSSGNHGWNGYYSVSVGESNGWANNRPIAAVVQLGPSDKIILSRKANVTSDTADIIVTDLVGGAAAGGNSAKIAGCYSI